MWNATILCPNTPPKLIQEAKDYATDVFTTQANSVNLATIYLANGNYTVFIDSFQEYFDSEGIFSSLHFCVLDRDVPIDCKLVIKSPNEDTILYEEIVKKKPLHPILQRRQVFISKNEQEELCEGFNFSIFYFIYFYFF